MRQAFFSLVFVFSLFFPAMQVMAQDDLTPVPEATAETASVGASGPTFRNGGEQLDMAAFVDMVIQDANVTWGQLFQDWGYSYVAPTFVTVDAGAYARSGCGINAGNPAEDPWLSPAFYCPYGGELGIQVLHGSDVFATEVTYEPVIYLSLPWLEQRVAAETQNPDFAVAYLVTYELATHVEHLLGYIDHTGGGCCDYTDVQIHLTADCLTGVWAFSAYDRGNLKDADVQAAQDAVWDEETGVPEEFGLKSDHGTPDQRLLSVMTGYDSGSPGTCFQIMLGG